MLSEIFFPHFLTVEKQLRKGVVETVAGALVYKKRPDYKRLMMKCNAYHDRLVPICEVWKDRREGELNRLFEDCKLIPKDASG